MPFPDTPNAFAWLLFKLPKSKSFFEISSHHIFSICAAKASTVTILKWFLRSKALKIFFYVAIWFFRFSCYSTECPHYKRSWFSFHSCFPPFSVLSIFSFSCLHYYNFKNFPVDFLHLENFFCLFRTVFFLDLIIVSLFNLLNFYEFIMNSASYSNQVA